MLYAIACLACLALTLLLLGYRISGLLLHPPRRAITRSPGEYGLDYQNVDFTSKDGLNLKGWWIPVCPDHVALRQEPAPVAVLLHPMFGNRQGSFDRVPAMRSTRPTGLDMLTAACRFHSAGFAVLLFDFRNHGESQSGVCAGGYNEDQDVVGAVDYVFQRVATEAPGRAPQVGLAGFGLGASAAISAIGREKGDGRIIRVFSADNEGATGLMEFQPANIKRLSFVVAIGPVSLRTWLRDYLRRLFPPLAWLLVPIVNHFYRWRSGYPLDGALLLKHARHVYTPTLYVQSQEGPSNTGDEAQQLYEATPGPRQMWRIEEPPNHLALYDYVSDHLEPVLEFAKQQRSTGTGQVY